MSVWKVHRSYQFLRNCNCSGSRFQIWLCTWRSTPDGFAKGIVAPALPLRCYIYWNGVTETSKNHQRTEAPPNSNEASPCCSLTTLNLSWNSLGWDANRWLGEKGPYMATDVIAKRYTHTQTCHIYHIIIYYYRIIYNICNHMLCLVLLPRFQWINLRHQEFQGNGRVALWYRAKTSRIVSAALGGFGSELGLNPQNGILVD